MNQSMITAGATMGQLQKRIDTIANNLANSETTGFKKSESKFSDLLVQQIQNQRDVEETKTTPAGIRVGSGAKLSAVKKVFTQGAIKVTERPLDLALTKENLLFEIQGLDGARAEYTRAGAFYLSPLENGDGLALVNADGRNVVGENGPIILPENTKEIAIDEYGNIQAELTDGRTISIDRFKIVQAINPQYLEPTGDNLYQISPNIDQDLIIQAAPDTPIIQQGALEQSNVDIGQEMVKLLETQRTFQLNAKSISYANDMMGIVNSIR